MFTFYRAMFSKRSEICPLVRKLLKICTGYVDPNARVEYGQYGDELKIKKNVLVKAYPRLCDTLSSIFGSDLDPLNITDMNCEDLRKQMLESEFSRDIFEQLYKYARDNMLWLNAYVKDSFATRIIRDERTTYTRFVANVGGLLGLCMGFSLVSAAEIMYFCCKKQPSSFYQKLCEIRKRRRRKRTKNGSIPTSRGDTIANSLNFDNIEANFRSIDDAESA